MTGFYERLSAHRKDDDKLRKCIDNVVDKLDRATDPKRPGMLLGKIQSGKTRAFLGVIALAFDRGFDVAVVLTKGTKTLARQTVKRIGHDFKEFVDKDEILLFDIMEAPESLTRAELRRKIIIVAKKQVHNLTRIRKILVETYPELRTRRVLLVDDEADLASVRFTKKKGESDFDQGRIASQMDELRQTVGNISFLQVTATPYSLYLQPDSYEDSSQAKEVFHPKRPAFTELLPIHAAYVGGETYFGNHGTEDPRHYLYVEVPDHEHDALRSNDGRVIREDHLWVNKRIVKLRHGLAAFLLAVAIRRRQQEQKGEASRKYAMIIHNDTQRSAHKWQLETVNKLVRLFETAAADGDARLRELFDAAYDDLKRSVTADGGHMPTPEEGYADLLALINDGELNVQQVNSDVDLEPLLDVDTAELRLRTKANVFIGGSILDRGITVPNLISFYYGRNPKRMQADTALQHSRMYGARPKADIAVTRFYTSRAVYIRLRQIHDLETTLREAFESSAQDGAVVFIKSDRAGGVVPCAPSKIALSDIVTLRPSDILLPTGFDTVASSNLAPSIRRIDAMVPPACLNTGRFAEIDLEAAIQVIDQVEPTLVFNGASDFDWGAMRALLRYHVDRSGGAIAILCETDRRLSRAASGDRTGLSILGSEKLRALVRDPGRAKPALILLKQIGGSELGWKAGPFWWPMLAVTRHAAPCVFAKNAAP
jgi:hypothetical protein